MSARRLGPPLASSRFKRIGIERAGGWRDVGEPDRTCIETRARGFARTRLRARREGATRVPGREAGTRRGSCA